MQSKLIGSVALLTLALVAGPASAAQIYKTVDKDGNVVFTDVPPSDKSGEVQLEEYNSYQPVTPAKTTRSASPSADAAETEDTTTPATVYELISIASPGYDEAVRQNAGMVTVAVNTTPQLDTAAGHQLQVLLDGVVKAKGSSTSLMLENVDRGTHEVTAQITNAEGEVLAQSAPTTFHLLRYSVLTKPKPKPQSGS